MTYKTFIPCVECPHCGVGMINCNSHNDPNVEKPKYMKCINKDCQHLGHTYKRLEVIIEDV